MFKVLLIGIMVIISMDISFRRRTSVADQRAVCYFTAETTENKNIATTLKTIF